VNRLELIAQIASMSILRYSPVGIPVLDFMLLHDSTVVEANEPRKIQLEMKSIAIGSLAERVQGFELGSIWSFDGFLGSSKNKKICRFPHSRN